MKTCAYCGRENADDSISCRECGVEFPSEESIAESRKSFFVKLKQLFKRLNTAQQKVLIGAIYILVFIVAAYFITSYLNRPRMTADEVVRLGFESAGAQGFYRDEYWPQQAYFKSDWRGRYWTVVFSRKMKPSWVNPAARFKSALGAPHNIVVEVEDATGRATVTPLKDSPPGTGKILPIPPGVKVLGYTTQQEQNVEPATK